MISSPGVGVVFLNKQANRTHQFVFEMIAYKIKFWKNFCCAKMSVLLLLAGVYVRDRADGIQSKSPFNVRHNDKHKLQYNIVI